MLLFLAPVSETVAAVPEPGALRVVLRGTPVKLELTHTSPVALPTPPKAADISERAPADPPLTRPPATPPAALPASVVSPQPDKPMDAAASMAESRDQVIAEPSGGEPAEPYPEPAAAYAPGPAAGYSDAPSLVDLSRALAAAVERAIQARLSYPEAARRRGIEGSVALLVRVSAEGRLVSSRVSAGSGSALLDKAALSLVASAFPMDNPSARELEFTLSVRYGLSE